MQIRNCVINKSQIFSASVSRPRVDSEPVLSIGEPMFTLLPARFFQRIGRGGELWPPFRTGSGRERCPISHHHFRIDEPRVEDDVCGSSRDSEPPNVVLSNDDVFFFQYFWEKCCPSNSFEAFFFLLLLLHLTSEKWGTI